MRLRLGLLWLAAIALGGCPLGLPKVGGVNITCASNSDCASLGGVCDLQYGICVAADAGVIDGGPPDAGPAVCTINGQRIDAGTYNPNQPCQTCEPAANATGWSNLTGTPADGGCQAKQVCNAGSCAPGCVIGGVFEPPGGLLAGNVCHVCEPALSNSAAQNLTGLPADAGCGAGSVCNAGICTPGCFIADAGFVNPQAVSASNPCEQCAPATSVSSYSPFTGTAKGCATGEVCDDGGCAAGCIVDSAFVPNGSVDPSGCNSCNAAVNAVTELPDATPCDAGGTYCKSGACVNDCLIGGGLMSNDTIDPTNSCVSCQPSVDATNWSPLATSGAACTANGGNYCVAGSCTPACDISDAIVDAGTVSPSNSCQSCQPNVSMMSYSAVMDGTSCSAGGTYCVGGACANDCMIGGALIPNGTLDGGNPNVCCNVGASKASWTPGFAGALTTPSTTGSPVALAIGDVTGDGIADLVIGEVSPEQIEIMQGKGDGTFTLLAPAISLPTGAAPLVLADFNHDGFLDVAVANSNSVTILLNQTDGGFASSTVTGIKKPTALVVADLQAAGSRDIVVGAETLAALPALIGVLNEGGGTFTTAGAGTAILAESVTGLAVGNLSGAGPGAIDIAALGAHAVTVVTFQNSGSTATSGTPTPFAADNLVALASSNLDSHANGLSDLVIADAQNNQLIPLLNGGAAAFTAQTGLAVTAPSAVVTADLNGDGLPDIACASGNGDVVVFINQTAAGGPNLSFDTPAGAYAVGAQPIALAASVLIDGGLPDLVSASSANNNLSVLLGQCP